MRLWNIKIISGVVGVGIIFLLGFFALFRNEEVLPDNTASEQRSPKNKEFPAIQHNDSFRIGFEEFFQPVISPFLALTEEKNFYEDEVQNPNLGPEYTRQSETIQTHPVGLSESEIFDILWPESYRDALIMLQDLMVKDGFMPESEKVSHMTSDDHIYAALLKIADYVVKQGWMGSVDAIQLQKGIQELERTISMERANLRATGKVSTGVLLPGGQNINKTPLAKQDFFSMIIDGLIYSLATHSANAQIPGGGNWVTSPDCYKDLAPTNTAPGVNLWAFCCNCGLYCIAYYCEYIDDCGPYSTQCNVPLGCLNLICGAWPNAIWDPLTSGGTGICGCG